MYLEHVNLWVKDMDETLNFYRAAFPHWQVRGGGTADWYGKSRNWLHFGDETHYLAFNDSAVGENRDLTSTQLGLAHFAFVTDNIDMVIDRVQQAGYEIHKDGAESAHRRNIYFLDPNGYEVEFVQYLTDLPQHRNAYE